MANPLDMVTEDQSVEPDADGLRRVVIRTPGALAPDLGTPTGLADNKLMRAVAPEAPSDLMTIIQQVKDRLLGTGGQERFQTWPERMVRGALDAPHAAMTSETPITSDQMIAPAQDMAGLASGSTLFVKPGAGTLGSGALRPGAKAMPVEPTPVFYSALEHAATNAAQETMSPQQWLGYLKNQPGVKQEELNWTGIGDWLGQQKEKVSKKDVQAYLDEHKVEIKDVIKSTASQQDAIESYVNETSADLARRQGRPTTPAELDRIWGEAQDHFENVENDTKYSSYQLPGGENYREHLLTMPTRGGKERLVLGSGSGKLLAENDYRSSHWDEPNVLAHVRTNDRDVGGKKSLHIEEIQSDWHQQGRKQGYRPSIPQRTVGNIEAQLADKGYKIGTARRLLDGDGNEVSNMAKLARREGAPDDVLNLYDDWLKTSTSDYTKNTGVPDAPFKTTWPELALKRMVRHAAENGYDRISWTPGEAQAARYDLSKTIKKIQFVHNRDQIGTLQAMDHQGRVVIDKAIKDPRELPDIIGKEAAEKLMSDAHHDGNGIRTLDNADLKVGGEGMREFYDKMLPKMAEKIGKAHGVKVKTTEAINGGKEQLSKNILSHPNLKTILDEMQYNHPTRAGWSEARAHKFLKDLAKSDPEKFVRQYEKLTGNYDDPHMRISSMDDVVPALHYFDLPQSLKDHAIGKGFPLYMSGVPFPLTPVDHDPFKEKK